MDILDLESGKHWNKFWIGWNICILSGFLELVKTRGIESLRDKGARGWLLLLDRYSNELFGCL